MPTEDGHKSKLSLHSSGYNSSFEKINIFLKKFKNLPKADGLTLYIKAEFNESAVGESPKYQITADNVPELNFSFSINVNTADPNSLDDISNKPIIITVLEIPPPKDRRSKDEKVRSLGQATIDLVEFVRGRTELSSRLPVHPVAGSSLEAQLNTDSSLQLEIEARISVEQPLLLDEEVNRTNLITVSFESMYSLPDSWVSAVNNKEYAYSAALPLPVNDDKDSPVVFVNGVLKSANDSVAKNKRWSDTRGIQAASAIYIPSSQVEDQSGGVDEWGDFISKEDKDYRSTAEKEKPRVVWGCERRCFLSANSFNALKDQVLKTRYWPVEIMRSAIPTGQKGKREEDLNMSYHGVAYLDLQPLLYPGATHIRGAYRILPFIDNDFTAKTKRKTGIVEEALKTISTVYDKNFSMSAGPVKKDQKGLEKREARKPKDSTADLSAENQSIQQILDSKSFIVIDIKFEKPLIPRKPFEYLTNRISELIPPRPKYPLKVNSAQKAVEDYQSQLKSIVNLIAEDFRNLSLNQDDLFSRDGSFNPKRENEFEIKRRKLLYELNSSGKYFAFKEQLKNSVIKIVREKFLRTSAFNDQDEFQQFLSELYVFLVDEMHKLLNDYLSVEDETVAGINLTDVEQLKCFAHEAEMNQNYDLAAYYYQERIAREKDSYSNWLDYAVFNLLIDDSLRAEECLKECISIDPSQINALMLYSVICSMQERFETAETFLERVTAQESDNVVAWTLYAMLYERKGEEMNADITIKKVVKMNQIQVAEQQATNDSHIGEEAGEVSKREDDLFEEIKLPPELSKSRNSKRGTITQQNRIKLDGSSKSKSPAVSSKTEEPQMSAKDKLAQSELAINKSIYMRTAQFLIKHKAFAWAENCMAKELLSPTGGPSCQYNLLLTKIKLAKNELNDAERYCVEALQFDYMSVKNCEAWILWANIRYIGGDLKGAKERFERVLLFSELPSDQIHTVYIRLASIYLKEENYEDSKKLFLHPCKNSPTCMSWLGVGICCYRMDQLEDAKIALSEANILNNKAPEVWAYLSLISLRTNKPLEAEQAYKYAIKLHLDNPELLEEIHNLQEQLGFGNPEF